MDILNSQKTAPNEQLIRIRMQDIIDLKFIHSEDSALGIDIITISERYEKHNTHYQKRSLPKRLGFYAMMYVTEGRGQHIIDFMRYNIGPNTLIIIGKNQVHQFSPQQSFDGHLILFEEEMLHRALLNFDTTIASFLFNPLNSSAFCINNAKPLVPDIMRLIEEFHLGPNDSARLPIVCHELGIILLKTTRLDRQQTTKGQYQELPPKLIAFSHLLEQHYASHWTAKEYALKLHISTKTLGLLTRKYLNRTPRDVINRRLFLEIKRQLAHSNLSVKEIAFQLGFDDPSNLNKFFKRRQNHTPQEFRQTLRASI